MCIIKSACMLNKVTKMFRPYILGKMCRHEKPYGYHHHTTIIVENSTWLTHAGFLSLDEDGCVSAMKGYLATSFSATSQQNAAVGVCSTSVSERIHVWYKITNYFVSNVRI